MKITMRAGTRSLKKMVAVAAIVAGFVRTLGEASDTQRTEGAVNESNILLGSEEADYEKCQAQLNIIYSALRQYQKEKSALPEWLSDLLPEFLHDASVLTCPYVNSSGKKKEWREHLKVFPVYGDPRFSYYGYEFRNAAIPLMPGTTVRQFKQRQMQLLGFGVPIVRCLAHERALNLAYDGTIYKNKNRGIFWEDVFDRYPGDEDVLHASLDEDTSLIAVRRLLRPRLPNISPHCLNLSNYYNATLLHLSQVNYDGTLIENVSNEAKRIDGVEYEIRGLIHLTGKNFPIPFPENVDGGIAVDRSCSRIHLLHGAVGEAQTGSIIATYIFHLENGKSHPVPIVYGDDVENRFFDPDESESESVRPAWVSPPGPQSSKYLRLYLKSWKNPQPEVKVTKIEFVSMKAPSAPFLVAVTLK